MTTLLKNRYQVIDVLSESGGFGETFLAEDTDTPSRRRCVIKKLKPIADEEAFQLLQERFGREAAILEKLGDGSDQIPKLYAYFVEKHEFYLVQQYIGGPTLRQLVRQTGPLDELEVGRILKSLLDVLAFIHGENIIHRDIKPDNIILRQWDGKPVLIDFGIVKEVLRLDDDGSPTLSIMAGTPGYSAPEQAAGRPVFSSDLYGLGATAIYLLTGINPKKMSDPTTGDISWEKHAPDLSPGFAALLNKAVESHPRDRYRSVDEMAAALHETVAGASSTARPPVDLVNADDLPAADQPHQETPRLRAAMIIVWSIALGLLALMAAYTLIYGPYLGNLAVDPPGRVNAPVPTPGPGNARRDNSNTVRGTPANASPSPSPSPTPTPGPGGSYENGDGSVSLRNVDQNGMDFGIEIARSGCVGSIKGHAFWTKRNSTASALIKKEGFNPDPKYPGVKPFCSVTLNFTGSRVTVSESDCNWFHGAACDFNGTFVKK